MLVLNHAGRRGACRPRSEGVDLPLREGGWPLVSASPIPYSRRSATPAELDEEGMERIRDAFVDGGAARAPRRASTPSSSTSARATCSARSSPRARTAARTRYGKDRLRFPRSVVEAVRAALDGPLAVRLSDGASAHAAALREAGADLVHVATGQATEGAAAEYRRGHLTAFSDRIRSEAHVPTMVGGYLDTLDAANTIVGAGRPTAILEPTA